MNKNYVSVPTRIKARFRITDDSNESCFRKNGINSPSKAMQDVIGMSRQSGDAVLRFLVEMDRKLDVIVGLLQRESLIADFPMQGTIVELGGEGLSLQTTERFREGEYLEVLLEPEPPLRMMSVMAKIEGREANSPASPAGRPGERTYTATYSFLSEDDRDAIIGFIFTEERKLIRQKKDEEKS